jgi:hypothetical protein
MGRGPRLIRERIPTGLVAAGLVFQDQLPDGLRQEGALPVPFGSARLCLTILGRGGTGGSDGVGGCPQLVLGHMADGSGLLSGVGGEPGRAGDAGCLSCGHLETVECLV